GSIQVELVTDSPDEQRRVIAVFQNFLSDPFFLLRHRGRIRIVEPVPLPRHIEAERDRQPERLRTVENGRCVSGAPRTDRIAAACGDLRHVACPSSRALDVVRLASTEKPIDAIDLSYLNTDRSK